MRDSTIFYTINESSGAQVKLEIDFNEIGGYEGIPAEPVVVKMLGKEVEVQPQQLVELASLFLALAGVEGIDFDVCDALVDSYDLRFKEVTQRLTEAAVL